MTIREELGKSQPIVDRVNEAIRENPLAASLIGAGIAWMLLGGTKGIAKVAGAAATGAVAAGSAASNLASTTASAGARTASAVSDKVSELAASAASIVPDVPAPDADKALEALAGASDAVANRVHAVAAAGNEYGAVIQSRLSEALDRQPLVLGAIGLGIGAVMASAFRSTEFEGELFGERGKAARETLEGLNEEVKDRAERVMTEVRDEVQRQGLAPEGLKDAATAIVGKVKTVASAAKDPFASPS